jgi:Protein of unknown function (DUF3826)
MRAAMFCSIACLAASAALPAFAIDEPKTPAPDAEAEYTRALEKRAADVLDVLKLDDSAKAAHVREVVIAEYRSLRKVHDARDAGIKAARDLAQPERDERIRAERERGDAAAAALNETFLGTLAADLAPEQVEQVKDKLTYNKLQVTYKAYLEMLPDLTSDQKQAVFAMLKEARDRAVPGGSAEEKSDVFNKYKGRINNYLSAQGYDLKLATKQWAERRKQAK